MLSIVFATNNSHKINEIQNMLPESIQIISLESIGCYQDIPETSTTIQGNAMQKANYITQKYGYPCFADDTGLEVEALNGAPGVYSARYAGPQRNAIDNNQKLLTQLQNNSNRNAQFKTVIALNINQEQHLFTGICKGIITTQPIGNQGFGYDPVFIPNGYTQTFAELSLDQKNTISHRGHAVRELITYLSQLI